MGGSLLGIRVLLADDQTLIRMGLKAVLRPERDIEVVGESENCRDALEKAVALSPDLVLMDLLTSGGGGIEATRAIKHQCPTTQVLILTVFADPGLFRKAAAAGASGYVLKDISPENLTNAIRAVHSGKTMISPVMARHMMDGLFNGNGATPATTNGHRPGVRGGRRSRTTTSGRTCAGPRSSPPAGRTPRSWCATRSATAR